MSTPGAGKLVGHPLHFTVYVCVYIYIYKHPADTQFPPLFPLCFPSHCAGGAHCLARGAHMRGGSYDWFDLVWTLGDIRWQSARSARVPIPGPSHPGVQLRERTQSGFAISSGVQPEEKIKRPDPGLTHSSSKNVPGYLVPSLNLCLNRAARKCGPSQGCHAFDFQGHALCVVTHIPHPEGPTRGQGRVGGRKLTSYLGTGPSHLGRRGCGCEGYDLQMLVQCAHRLPRSTTH